MKEKIEELFTDTSALYEDLNRVMREKSGTHDYTYTAEIRGKRMERLLKTCI